MTLVHPYLRMYIFEQFKQHMNTKRQRDDIPHHTIKRSRSSGPRQYKRKTQMDNGVRDRYSEGVGEFYCKNDDPQDDSGNYGKSPAITVLIVDIVVDVVVGYAVGGIVVRVGENCTLGLFP